MPLGDYERLECVGKGNQGSVYRVLHRATGRTYVLKRAELDADDPTLRAAALREAETLGSLQHACVVRYEESFVEMEGERTFICIVMEYCAGGDLHRRVEQAAAAVVKGGRPRAAPSGGPDGGPPGFFPESQVRAAAPPRRARRWKTPAARRSSRPSDESRPPPSAPDRPARPAARALALPRRSSSGSCSSRSRCTTCTCAACSTAI